MTRFVSIGLLLGVSLAGCELPRVSARSPAENSSPRQIWADYLRPHLKTLSREIHVYSWATKAGPGLHGGDPMRPNDPRTQSYLKSILDRFREDPPEDRRPVFGEGIYAALDPVVSYGFGQPGGPSAHIPHDPAAKDWVLFDLTVPAGTRFLSALDGEEIMAPSQAIRDRLPTDCAFFGNLFTEPTCRELRDRMIVDLGLSMVRYSYFTAQFPGACPKRADASMLVFDPKLIQPSVLRTLDFQSRTDPSTDEARAIIQKLFEMANPKPDQSEYPYAGFPWPGQSDRPKADFKQWVQSQLMYCGNFAEDL